MIYELIKLLFLNKMNTISIKIRSYFYRTLLKCTANYRIINPILKIGECYGKSK